MNVALERVQLADGRKTTVHVAAYDGTRPAAGVHDARGAAGAVVRREGVTDAVSGGFATKPEYEPLGELWIDGIAISHVPFADPWHAIRGALLIDDGRVEIDRLDRLQLQPGQARSRPARCSCAMAAAQSPASTTPRASPPPARSSTRT